MSYTYRPFNLFIKDSITHMMQWFQWLSALLLNGSDFNISFLWCKPSYYTFYEKRVNWFTPVCFTITSCVCVCVYNLHIFRNIRGFPLNAVIIAMSFLIHKRSKHFIFWKNKTEKKNYPIKTLKNIKDCLMGHKT